MLKTFDHRYTQTVDEMRVRHRSIFTRKGVIGLLLSACLFLSLIIPPLKSPDEHDHIKRAYLLTQGFLVLESHAHQSSGGLIDTGLLDYFSYYPRSQIKIETDTLITSKRIEWSGSSRYVPLPGTGYYLPIIYLPQATALFLGQKLRLSVDDSYHLARLFAMLSAVGMLWAAFNLYAAPPLVLALLSLPMTLFQLASASLEALRLR